MGERGPAMSTYTINGLDCEFKGLHWDIINDYHPTPHTHLYIFKAHEPQGALFLLNLVEILALVKALGRKKHINMTDGRYCVLFEYIDTGCGTYTIKALDKYASILCGPSYMLVCPYHAADIASRRARIDIYSRNINSAVISAKTSGTPLPQPCVDIVQEWDNERDNIAATLENDNGRFISNHDEL